MDYGAASTSAVCALVLLVVIGGIVYGCCFRGQSGKSSTASKRQRGTAGGEEGEVLNDGDQQRYNTMSA